MTQTVPATCVLGPGKTGLTIGYRVLNLDGTTYAAFATTGVSETSIAGTYRKAGGVVVPAAGGYIVWGVSGTDLAEATVETAPPSASDNATAAAAAILATPANKLAVDSSGAAAANVTAWNGAAPSDLDANGYIRTDVMSWDGSSVDEVYPLVRPIDNSDGIEYIDRIYIRDAMKLAPSAGAAAAGSVDAQLGTLALEATAQNVKAKTDLITTGLVTVTSPVTTDGDVTVYQGDDYHNGDGCALAWSSSSWPDLTGAAVTLTVKAPSGELLTVAGSAVDPGTATQTVRVELTAAETATLVAWPGPSTVRMRATLSNGRVRTLVDSKLAAIEALA